MVSSPGCDTCVLEHLTIIAVPSDGTKAVKSDSCDFVFVQPQNLFINGLDYILNVVCFPSTCEGIKQMDVYQYNPISQVRTLLQSVVGNQGNTWYELSLNVSSPLQHYQLIIAGVVGFNFTSDIAIDDVLVRSGLCGGRNFSYKLFSSITLIIIQIYMIWFYPYTCTPICSTVY